MRSAGPYSTQIREAEERRGRLGNGREGMIDDGRKERKLTSMLRVLLNETSDPL